MTGSGATLAGRWALITGAATGIGRAAALALAEAGAQLIVSDRSLEKMAPTVELVRSSGGLAHAFAADLIDGAAIDRLFAFVDEKAGHLDIAVNNAGISGPQLLTADLGDEDFDRVIAINLRSVFLCMRAELRNMSRHGGGSIVNTASAAGLIANRHACAYVAAKHGVLGLTKTAALEYATSGIRVNAVCPGVVRTPMLTSFLEPAGAERLVSQMAPMNRIAEPEEVASAILWLASDAASYVTGSSLVVDGGITAQ